MPPKPQRKRGKPLTPEQRRKIFDLHGKRFSNLKISAKISCTESVIRNTLKNYNAANGYASKKWNGANRKTTAAEDHIIKRLAVAKRDRSATTIVQMLKQLHVINISAQTVMNRLAGKGCKPRLLKKRPMISRKSKALRRNFAEQYGPWSWGHSHHRGEYECHVIVRILEDHLIEDGTRLCSKNFIMQADNDPKHKSRLAQK
ncbi:MAG: hypothetical protein EZS28_023724 [Streblomastix strix]|uniref:Transposase Tc1-like domain-containing protein n=1 Tax=Streblomastix strix TaxID=222440 RepID=A0A5J4VE17_9EUKA|nr:MAG: hypothetical protein EZS28_023724 [Streblomastix strix]